MVMAFFDSFFDECESSREKEQTKLIDESKLKNDPVFKLFEKVCNFFDFENKFNLIDKSKEEYGYRIYFESKSKNEDWLDTEIMIHNEFYGISLCTIGSKIPDDRVVEFIVESTKISGIVEQQGHFSYKSHCTIFSAENRMDVEKLRKYVDDHFKNFSRYHSLFISCVENNEAFIKMGE